MANTRKKLTPIGTTELIDFPDDAIFSIPAKIDTGADYSAIWASDIALDGDILCFTFFGEGSPYYDPEKVIRTDSFKIARVKNSFGHVELRYKVKILVRIGDKKLVRWCGLADRSRNAFPVLLGKNFLKNIFIVDVSQRHIAGVSKVSRTALLLSTTDNTTLAGNVSAQLSHSSAVTASLYSDLVYLIDGLDTLVSCVQGTDLIDIATYDIVYFKAHNGAAEIAASAAEYLKFCSRRFFDKEVGNYTSMTKLSEYMKLSCSAIPVPRTIYAANKYLLQHFAHISSSLGMPFVLKEAGSDRGKNNYLIHTEAEFKGVLQNAATTEQYIAQKYIPNNGFYRIYVMGKESPLTIWRASHPHKNPLKAHLNKPHGGPNAVKIELPDVPKEAIELATQAAGCMNRQIAGVDLVQDSQTKKWHVLEVNNAPQLREGSFSDDKVAVLAEFLKRELNR